MKIEQQKHKIKIKTKKKNKNEKKKSQFIWKPRIGLAISNLKTLIVFNSLSYVPLNSLCTMNELFTIV
jgi:hypothetical protein